MLQLKELVCNLAFAWKLIVMSDVDNLINDWQLPVVDHSVHDLLFIVDFADVVMRICWVFASN